MCLLSIHYYFENYFSSLMHTLFLATGNTLTLHIGFLFHIHIKLFLLHALTFEKAVIPTKATTNSHAKKLCRLFCAVSYCCCCWVSRNSFLRTIDLLPTDIREFLLVPIGSTGSAIRYSESLTDGHIHSYITKEINSNYLIKHQKGECQKNW